MKIEPRYATHVGKRIDKNPINDWAYITWNDGTQSWRRVYKSYGRNLIFNKGKLFEVKPTGGNSYNCIKLSNEESSKISKEIKSAFNESFKAANEKFGNESENNTKETPFLNEEVEEIVNEVKNEVLNSSSQFVDFDLNAKHPEYNTILTCVKKNIPVYLVGPAGTGKSTVLRGIAEELEMDFYSTNSVQDEFKLTGFKDASGDYQDTEFYKAFTKGGIFFLDELDASIPSVLVLLNTAIANRYFEFPNGRKEAHPNFRVVAAGNTFGNGADESYTGRMVIDQATLDRFIAIEYDYDYNVELAITKGNKHLVDFIHEVRQIAKRNGLRTTFSYRALEMITSLEDCFPLEKLYKMTIFKGLDEDTIGMFVTKECETKYEKALANIIK